MVMDEVPSYRRGMADDSTIREAAVKRLEAQRGFWRLLIIFVIVWAILIAVWALSGGGYFWPVWAILGMSIALAFVGLNAFGPAKRPISEERIQAEIERQRRSL